MRLMQLQARLMQLAQPRQVRQLEAREEPPPLLRLLLRLPEQLRVVLVLVAREEPLPLLRLLLRLPEQQRVVLVAKVLVLGVPAVPKEEPTVARVNKVVVSSARPIKSIPLSPCLLSSSFIAHIVVVPHTLP
jgi:hypothetical protein